MKHLKTLGLALVAAMALMAVVASSASATALYNGTTKLSAGAIIDFSIPSGTSAVLVDTSGNELDRCATSTVQGELSSAATGPIKALTWGNCTFTTSTVTLGKLEVVWTSGTNGTVKSDAQIEVTINTGLFGSCIYGVASGTSLGTLTTISSGRATVDTNAVVTKVGTNFVCPPTAKWMGSYTSTEPDNLRVEAN
jgi:Flp pilus assembly protein TadG